MSIELKNVTYTYSPGTAYEIHALKDINLSIPDGQFIGIIGHTGSGKSTLIQHFNALIRPTSGTITYNGEDIWGEKYDRRTLRSEVGLVFQYPEHQLFENDVLSDVCFGPMNQGLSREEAEVEAKKEHREPVLLPNFSAHSLRHTFCTRLCERETNLKVIQSIMGHKDIQTTMDIYAEATEEKKQETFEHLAATMDVF